MAWNYAELSKAAKNAGGPEALVDTLINSGKEAGKAEMAPWLIVALAAGSAATFGISKLIGYLKEKKAISEATVEKAKSEIIQGIKDYDAEHDFDEQENNDAEHDFVEQENNDEAEDEK